jgi:Fe-S cluster assembly ATP-binding protein
MLEEIGSVERAESYILNALKEHRKIMGFGHRVYKTKDPRSTVLQHLGNEVFEELGIAWSFAARYLNDGFSGGEKKRAEILQMAMLEPEIAILDETDSGLDIDALRIVSEGVNALRGPDLGVLVITHYQRILRYIQPDKVHIMMDGRIVESGGPALAEHLEEHGYDWLRERMGA